MFSVSYCIYFSLDGTPIYLRLTHFYQLGVPEQWEIKWFAQGHIPSPSLEIKTTIWSQVQHSNH